MLYGDKLLMGRSMQLQQSPKPSAVAVSVHAGIVPAKKQPGTVLAYDKATARTKDLNGYIEIKDNPISKAGIFDYSGAQLGMTGDDAGRIFKVYRPAEELADQACIDSFKLLPFVDEHAMLGSEDSGATPAERKGVQGYIGEQVRFDPPYLRGNLKIVSESMKSAIDNGKIELSPGYRCVYDLTPGTFEGQHYDAVQRRIRGNHLALVDEGRTGPDVAVLDRMTFTVDTKEIAKMGDEEKPGGDALAEIKSLLEKLVGMMTDKAAPAADAEKPAETAKATDADAEKPAAEAEKPAMDAKVLAALDSVSKQLESVTKRLEAVEKGQTGMDASLVGSIADRDALASRLSGFVGTFDHARMTVADVAKYGVEKLKIPCAAGQERIALDAYLHGRVPEYKLNGVALDGANGTDLLGNWAESGKGAN